MSSMIWKCAILLLALIDRAVALTVDAVDSTGNCGKDWILKCRIDGTFDSGVVRSWKYPGDTIISTGNILVDRTKYSEDISNANYFSITVKNVSTGDIGIYKCGYGFPSATGYLGPCRQDSTPTITRTENNHLTFVVNKVYPNDTITTLTVYETGKPISGTVTSTGSSSAPDYYSLTWTSNNAVADGTYSYTITIEAGGTTFTIADAESKTFGTTTTSTPTTTTSAATTTTPTTTTSDATTTTPTTTTSAATTTTPTTTTSAATTTTPTTTTSAATTTTPTTTTDTPTTTAAPTTTADPVVANDNSITVLIILLSTLAGLLLAAIVFTILVMYFRAKYKGSKSHIGNAYEQRSHNNAYEQRSHNRAYKQRSHNRAYQQRSQRKNVENFDNSMFNPGYHFPKDPTRRITTIEGHVFYNGESESPVGRGFTAAVIGRQSERPYPRMASPVHHKIPPPYGYTGMPWADPDVTAANVGYSRTRESDEYFRSWAEMD